MRSDFHQAVCFEALSLVLGSPLSFYLPKKTFLGLNMFRNAQRNFNLPAKQSKNHMKLDSKKKTFNWSLRLNSGIKNHMRVRQRGHTNGDHSVCIFHFSFNNSFLREETVFLIPSYMRVRLKPWYPRAGVAFTSPTSYLSESKTTRNHYQNG